MTVRELAEHGDHGLGTLNGLDGELIVIDGDFFRAQPSGKVEPVPSQALTLFAVVAWFSPEIAFNLPPGATLGSLAAEIEARVPDPGSSLAIRVDGWFELVRARSVPRRQPPYRPLTEVIAGQTVFELEEVEAR